MNMKKSVLDKMNKNSLMDLARKMSIPGRSSMTKNALIEALLTQAEAMPAREAGKGTKRAPAFRTDIGVQVLNREEKAVKAPVNNSGIRPKTETIQYKIRKGKEKPVLRADPFGLIERKIVRGTQETLQQEVERGRFDLGSDQASPFQEVFESGSLPEGYGDTRIVLLVRDPYWIYTYWEIQESAVKEALSLHNLMGDEAQKVVRVYCGDESSNYDIDVEGLINNWYINVGRPNTEFFVDYGLRVQGRFIPLARSNRVRTPRSGMSEVIDDQWMTLEEESRMIYALSGGFRMGEWSLGLQEMMEKRLWEEISSGAVSSFFGSGQFREKERERRFWYRLDAELIVYGATDPDAKVTLQGRPVKLRADGTFSARFALPDGQQEIPVTFVSPDEIDKVTITPKVIRNTGKS